MTTGLKADLFLCPECGRPMEGSGKFKTLPKPLRTMRELECGHFVPYEKRPVFRRDPYAGGNGRGKQTGEGNKNSMPTREENARRLARETREKQNSR